MKTSRTAIQTYPKLCIYCEHFDLTAAYEEPGYSSWTPGYTVNARILCRRGYWEIDNETDNVNEYRKCIEKAKDCAEFQQIGPSNYEN